MNAQLYTYVEERKYDDLMTLLIRENYDINQRNAEGHTALHLACKVNDLEIAKALIAFDAEVNSINSLLKTPLDIVLERGDPNSELKDLLLKLDGKTYSTDSSEDEDTHKSLDQQDEDSHLGLNQQDFYGHSLEGQRAEADGESTPWSVSPPAKRSKTFQVGVAIQDRQTHQHHPGLQIQGHRRKRRMRNQSPLTEEKSTHNPQMIVQKSAIGECAVHIHVGRSMEPQHVFCDGEEGQRILCLDGGGIKGLIQIEMLKTIEQMTGKSISDLFDWVVGTSTGGILALGMIYGNLSLAELRRLYFDMKDTVFKQQSKFISCICDTDAMERLLKDTFGTERRMSRDSIKMPNVLIAAVDKSTTSLPLVFFNNCFDDKFSNELVWKVARYTSAAPVFFAERDNYVDGGVKANNPTHFSLTEIQDYLSKKHGPKTADANISCVVSLGCGEYPAEPLGNIDIANVLNITKLHLIHQCVRSLLILFKHAFSVSEEAVRMTRISCEQQDIAFFRFTPVIGKDVGTTEKDNRKLCDIIIRTKELFMRHTEQVETMIKELGFFDTLRTVLL